MSTKDVGINSYSDREIFVSDMVRQWQLSETPSDRQRVDAMVDMAVIANRISSSDRDQYNREKSRKFII